MCMRLDGKATQKLTTDLQITVANITIHPFYMNINRVL